MKGAPTLGHVAIVTQDPARHAEAKRRALPLPSPPLNHQVSLSLYLKDPEGNMLEVYWATGAKPAGPVAVPVDLELPEAELLALVQGG